MIRILTRLILISIVAVFFLACGDDNSQEKLRENELAILDEFISENYPDSVPKTSGLYYIETIKGEGDTILPGDKIQIFYATWTIDSFLVDQSEGYLDGLRYEPMEFVVGTGSVISGLDEAVTFMQLNGKSNLVLPSEVAYSQNGNGIVPGFTTLLMEVEIYKIYPLNPPDEEE
ncbi:MAG: FKBP-type peptidyl-prolyl cis-trans isomerase [Draconibacterium sp.]|nr:FKBP-type peptidyl-prolyl cis-trans isomerase [Draconibacterium sp.]